MNRGLVTLDSESEKQSLEEKNSARLNRRRFICLLMLLFLLIICLTRFWGFLTGTGTAAQRGGERLVQY
jgi:hypothetical protein